ncbi:MAG: phospholipase D-like domain-containing protein [Burkholderiaceae bacterium]
MTLFHWLTLHGLVTAVATLIYVIQSHVTHMRRQPAAAIAWMLFILLVPYLALPAYLIFGSRKQPRPQAQMPQPLHINPTETHWSVTLLQALNQPGPQAVADLRVHQDGKDALDSLLTLMANARRSIDLCTFILARDEVGQAVLARLIERAQAGIRVRVLLDGMGSLMTRPPRLRDLKAAGGECALFVPPLRSPRKGGTNLRNHRKLVLIDADSSSARLWTGGRNLASPYFEGSPPSPAWLDLSFQLGGPLTDQARQLFESDWRFATGRTTPEMGTPKDPPTTQAATRGMAQLVASGPDQADDTVYALLLSASHRAKDRIAISTPYFVPDAALQLALCLAARRGVQVDLLIPARSNHRLSDAARGRALRALAQAGARIWLTSRMLHAKLVLFDHDLALAGSANLDSRSLFLNYEMMFAFHERTHIDPFDAWYDRQIEGASAYQPRAPGLLRDTAEGLILWTGFQL